jgi:hypothetical protein
MSDQAAAETMARKFRRTKVATQEIVHSTGAVKGIPAASAAKDYSRPLAVVTTLFFMWGFLTCLNDVVSARLRDTFELSNFETGLVQTAFFLAYFVVSLPAGWVFRWRLILT